MRYLFKLCGAAFLSLLLFLCVGCGKEAPSPADAVLSLISEEKLPAGRLYDSEAAMHEAHYMPRELGKALYAIRGYDELSHIDSYAVYLGSGYDASFELAVFSAKDIASLSEVTDMCRIRAEYLIEAGRINENEFVISVTGKTVYFVVGMDREEALSLVKR